MNKKILGNYLSVAVLFFSAFLFTQLLFYENSILDFKISDFNNEVAEFDKNIKNGIMVPRWAQDFNSGYGSPFFIFNPPLLYYVSECYYFFINNSHSALKFSCFIVLFLSSSFAYILLKDFFERFLRILLSLSYMSALFFLKYLSESFTLSQMLSFSIFPMTVWSFYRLADSKGLSVNFFSLCSFSYALIVLSDIKASLIIFSFFFLYALFLILFFKKRFNRLLLCFAGILIGISLSAFFWMPAFFEKKYIKDKDYETVWVAEKKTVKNSTRFVPLKGNPKLMHEKIFPDEYFFRVNAQEDSRIRINIRYFPGWKAYTWDNYEKEPKEIRKIKIDSSNKYGLMELDIPAGYPLVDIKFESTPVRLAGDMLSFLGVIIIYFSYLLTRAKKEKIIQH